MRSGFFFNRDFFCSTWIFVYLLDDRIISVPYFGEFLVGVVQR